MGTYKGTRVINDATAFLTCCLVTVVISCWGRFLCDLLLYECLHDNVLLKEPSDFLPKVAISTSLKLCRGDRTFETTHI